MSGLDVIAWAVIALFVLNLAVTAFLVRLSSHHPYLTTLRSRAFAQVVLLACSGIGFVFALIRLTGSHLAPEWVTGLIAALVILPSAPGIYWAWSYFRGGFR